ncbi:hypothetical protein ASE41_09675 [Streptomyces sp. Root264]|nr:hypothetical protein ASE41_09675 [Streptomyces sp. Root264]
MASSSVIQVPVTLETNGMPGAESGTSATARSNAAAACAIIVEWKACEVRSRLVRTSRPVSSVAKPSIAMAGPDTTHSRGPLTAARARSPGSSGSSSASGRGTASIAPGAAFCIRRPRSATSRSASSGVSTPARHAATSSPRLCPSMAAGRTPQDIHSLASANSTTNSAGWA